MKCGNPLLHNITDDVEQFRCLCLDRFRPWLCRAKVALWKAQLIPENRMRRNVQISIGSSSSTAGPRSRVDGWTMNALGCGAKAPLTIRRCQAVYHHPTGLTCSWSLCRLQDYILSPGQCYIIESRLACCGWRIEVQPYPGTKVAMRSKGCEVGKMAQEQQTRHFTHKSQATPSAT
eukprot:scaffold4928_cov32-Tisochrysis_lutea.AAC.1